MELTDPLPLFFMKNQIRYSGKPIGSPDALAAALNIQLNELSYLAERGAKNYDFFSKQKKTGGVRSISAPSHTLKIVLRRINSRIFSNCDFPAYLQGSIKDANNPRDFVYNAKSHSSGSSFVLVDIKDFFPSIQKKHVYQIFKYLFKFPHSVAELLANLTTLNGVLPQGAPTSSYIANLIFYDHEPSLVEWLRKRGFVYSRLVDDITISSGLRISDKEKGEALGKVRAMASKFNMSLHKGKIKLLDSDRPGVNVCVTGLNIEKGKPRLPVSERKKIRAEVYRCVKDYESGRQMTDEYHSIHNAVSGRVALMTRLGYSCANGYREQLNNALPIYSKKKVQRVIASCYRFIDRGGSGNGTYVYAKRYYKLMYCLGITSRTNKKKAASIRMVMRPFRPIGALSEIE